MPEKTPLLRTIRMLMLIPRQPYKIDAATLKLRLAHYGYEPTLRTIQRDLVMLAQSFPLQCDGEKPQGWCWKAGARLMSLPALDSFARSTDCCRTGDCRCGREQCTFDGYRSRHTGIAHLAALFWR